MGGLRQPQFILSLFQTPEVQSQGVDRAVPSTRALEKSPLHASLQASGGCQAFLVFLGLGTYSFEGHPLTHIRGDGI